MRMSFDGGQYRRRPTFPVRVNRLRALDDAPAIIAPSLDAIDHLPKFPTHVRHPKRPALPIKTHPPWVPQTVGPNLRTRPLAAHERIVRGNAIAPGTVNVVDIDPQDRRQEIARVLARLQRVGWVR